MNWNEHDLSVRNMVVSYPAALECEYRYFPRDRCTNMATKWAPCHRKVEQPMPVCGQCYGRYKWERIMHHMGCTQYDLHAEFLKRGYFGFFRSAGCDDRYIKP